uniref:Uncharacterized protein n=1 Tax=Oryza nivara TaxID=4536 RepID=A0A0E0G6T4_ORYNI
MRSPLSSIHIRASSSIFLSLPQCRPLAKPSRHYLRLDEANPFPYLTLPFPLRDKPPPPPLLPSETELVLSPFRPFQPSSLPATNLPECASTGNTICRRRHRTLATGSPAPRSPFSLPLSLSRLLIEEEEEEEEEERERKEK